MIKKGFSINYLPIRFSASIMAVAASQPVQEYDVTTNEYYPDRSLIPLVIRPVVSFTDPNTGLSETDAAARLTDGHWYRLDNTSGGALSASTEITSGSTYIIDTVAGSPTYGQLKAKENILPGNPVTYVFRATLVAPSGERREIIKSYQAASVSTSTIPTLQLDKAQESLYDPWSDTDTFDINPVLSPAIAGATYSWKTFHGTAWGALGSTHYDWAIKANGNGVRISRAIMQDRLLLRCEVAYTINGKQHTDSISASVTRRLPEKWEYDIQGISNIRQTDKSISPKAVIRSGKKIISDTKGEVNVIWYNAAGTEIARGLQPVIQVPALGSGLEIGLDITDAGGWKALETADGKYITDAAGNLLIAR